MYKQWNYGAQWVWEWEEGQDTKGYWDVWMLVNTTIPTTWIDNCIW